jgi:hypothetical protein
MSALFCATFIFAPTLLINPAGLAASILFAG